tara:strand:+ start:18698 stop:20056 length:1359 start_codon:yes stop_codon:yes gene_type:complete
MSLLNPLGIQTTAGRPVPPRRRSIAGELAEYGGKTLMGLGATAGTELIKAGMGKGSALQDALVSDRVKAQQAEQQRIDRLTALSPAVVAQTQARARLGGEAMSQGGQTERREMQEAGSTERLKLKLAAEKDLKEQKLQIDQDLLELKKWKVGIESKFGKKKGMSTKQRALLRRQKDAEKNLNRWYDIIEESYDPDSNMTPEQTATAERNYVFYRNQLAGIVNELTGGSGQASRNEDGSLNLPKVDLGAVGQTPDAAEASKIAEREAGIGLTKQETETEKMETAKREAEVGKTSAETQNLLARTDTEIAGLEKIAAETGLISAKIKLTDAEVNKVRADSDLVNAKRNEVNNRIKNSNLTDRQKAVIEVRQKIANQTSRELREVLGKTPKGQKGRDQAAQEAAILSEQLATQVKNLITVIDGLEGDSAPKRTPKKKGVQQSLRDAVGAKPPGAP